MCVLSDCKWVLQTIAADDANSRTDLRADFLHTEIKAQMLSIIKGLGVIYCTLCAHHPFPLFNYNSVSFAATLFNAWYILLAASPYAFRCHFLNMPFTLFLYFSFSPCLCMFQWRATWFSDKCVKAFCLFYAFHIFCLATEEPIGYVKTLSFCWRLKPSEAPLSKTMNLFCSSVL